MTCSRMSGVEQRRSRSMSAACWVETTTVSSRTGLSPSYSMVTWVLPSGRRYGDGAVLADLGEPPGEPVRQHDRQRHQLGGLVAGVAEHHALVAGALPVELVVGALDPLLVGVVDALGDVGRLRADRHRDAAGGAVEALLGRVVADVEDRLAHDRGDVDVGRGGDLAGDVHLAGGDQRLDGDPAARVLREQRVEDRVADLVGDLVGVALGDRLGGEQATRHSAAPTVGESKRVYGRRPCHRRLGSSHPSPAGLSPPVSRSATRSQTTLEQHAERVPPAKRRIALLDSRQDWRKRSSMRPRSVDRYLRETARGHLEKRVST